MRPAPTRFVLAVLTFIVGTVLALPMLLARKADAHDAPLVLESGGVPALTAEAVVATEVAAGDAECGLPEDAPSTGTPSGPVRLGTGEPGSSWLVASSDHGAFSRGRLERAIYFVDERPAAGWPAPPSIDKQRKYHLRP